MKKLITFLILLVLLQGTITSVVNGKIIQLNNIEDTDCTNDKVTDSFVIRFIIGVISDLKTEIIDLGDNNTIEYTSFNVLWGRSIWYTSNIYGSVLLYMKYRGMNDGIYMPDEKFYGILTERFICGIIVEGT